jgi:uncharacterized protein YacL
MARAIGLLFSLGVGGLSAWVAYSWSQLYVDYVRGTEQFAPFPYFGDFTYRAIFALLGMTLGFTLAILIYRQALDLAGSFVSDLRRIPGRDKAAVVLGLFIGLGLTALLGTLLFRIPSYGPQLVALVGLVCIYFGVVITLSMKEELYFFFPGTAPAQLQAAEEAGPAVQPKILDTNVIIDGRIADICRAGFLEGPIWVPGFVLEELHAIADSSDTLRRNRGRRGLDILSQMQQEPDLLVEVHDDVHPGIRTGDPVDAKLVQLAKELGAAIVTNDFNLNKVAQLQGVKVVNVNELANAVKPVVLPGEEMTVTIVREGKEPEQGVAYLDDGTMVVVERGKDSIGQTIRIIVTSVLQTVAGKMIFGSPHAGSHNVQEEADRHQRAGSGSGPRRKTR